MPRTACELGGSTVRMLLADLRREHSPSAAREFPDWDALPDGCLTTVLESLDLRSLVSARAVCRRINGLVDQPALWGSLFRADYPVQFDRLALTDAVPGWQRAYKRRHHIQRRWAEGPAVCTELRSHTGPVFAVNQFTNPNSNVSAIISGGVFGFGEVSELFQWNSKLDGLPLEWAASGQLGGILALAHCPNTADVIVGGFAGCSQIIALEEQDPSSMSEGEVHALCAGALPDAWLTQSHQELVARLQGYGSLFTVRHTHTLGGHEGPVPGAAASAGRSVGGPGIVVTSGFDGLTNIWRPSEVGPGQDPVAEEAVAVLRDEEDPARQVPDLPPPAGGAAEFAAQSQCVCTAAVHPTGATLTTGCNDYLIRNWDVERQAVTQRLRGHTGWVWCLEAQRGQPAVLLSGATDGRVKQWDLRVGELRGLVADMAISTPTAQGPNQGAVSGISLRPDGNVLVAGCFDTRVSVIDLRTWRVSQALEGHGHRVTRVAATDDGIFSASFDSTVRHWSFE